MGTSRRAAVSKSARPARSDPVNATAATSGADASAWPRSAAAPCSTWNQAAGAPTRSTAALTAAPVTALVAGCPGCALSTTGQPAAKADAVSPPAVLNANGKFEAANTATGPIGVATRRWSGRGGAASGRAVSMTASASRPSLRAAAKARSCPTVRATSPRNRSGARPVSRPATSTRSAVTASSSPATASSRSASSNAPGAPGAGRRRKASAAAAAAACASCGPASGTPSPTGLPSRGSIPVSIVTAGGYDAR